MHVPKVTLKNCQCFASSGEGPFYLGKRERRRKDPLEENNISSDESLTPPNRRLFQICCSDKLIEYSD